MKKLAVIGKDVSESLSPQIHNFISANIGNSLDYDKVSVPENEFDGVAEELFGSYDGFNVTIPYKLKIMPYLDKLSCDAESFGAVNTVRCGDRSGHNTDGEGFMLMLKSNGVEVCGKEVLLLGAGGAGRSVAKKLSQAGARVFVYDTHTESALKIANEFNGVKAVGTIERKPYHIIINATGIGMHKSEGVSPVTEDVIRLGAVAVDLIYTPEISEFLRLARKNGKKIINGKAMLFYQAYYAQCIFFEREADELQAKNLFNKFTEEVK